MITRALKSQIDEHLAQYPAVALVGARQVGKTTLAKEYSDLYFDLEQDIDRIKLDATWNDILVRNKLIILDEAQCYPEVFKKIRGTIDAERRKNGRFLILGSVAPSLMKNVAESLAGRLSVLQLTGFLAIELGTLSRLDDLWFFGGYPDGGILSHSTYGHWQRNYLRLLAERDLPELGIGLTPSKTRQLFNVFGTIHSQVLNASSLGKSLGVTYHTVNKYIDYLEGAFLLRKLLPYHTNIKKRLIKSPKIYWKDSGLLHALQGIDSFETLLNQSWVGASWEGFAIEQILETLSLQYPEAQGYFFRTSDGYEADLVINLNRKLYVIEIKLSSSPSSEAFTRLNKIGDLVGADKKILLSRTQESFFSDDLISCNLLEFLNFIRGN